MTILTDIAAAFDTYVDDEVTLNIINVNPPGSVVDVNEKVPFQIRIENGGHVNMTGVSLHVHGLNGALVSAAQAGPYSGTITVSGLTVNAGTPGNTQTTATLYFQAPSTPRAAGTDLVSTHVHEWNANFNHYFTNHTNESNTPLEVYESAVDNN